MAVCRVPIANIRPNPFLEFLARRAIETESESVGDHDDSDPGWRGGTLNSLAEAIKSDGLLSPLRGRERNGYVELCFGHRRLAAVNLLGWSEVDVDMAILDDAAMVVGSMLENLHRKDLDRIQRAESVVAAVEQLMTRGDDHASAREKVKTMLGVSDAWISVQFLMARDFDQVEKDLVRKGNIPVTNAVEAHRIGGTRFVTRASEEKLSLPKIRSVAKALDAPRDPKVRSKLLNDLKAGKPLNEIQRVARRKPRKQKQAQPTMNEIVSEWATKIENVMDELEQNLHSEDVGSADKEVRGRFRKVVRAATKTLEAYLH